MSPEQIAAAKRFLDESEERHRVACEKFCKDFEAGQWAAPSKDTIPDTTGAERNWSRQDEEMLRV